MPRTSSPDAATARGFSRSSPVDVKRLVTDELTDRGGIAPRDVDPTTFSALKIPLFASRPRLIAPERGEPASGAAGCYVVAIASSSS